MKYSKLVLLAFGLFLASQVSRAQEDLQPDSALVATPQLNLVDHLPPLALLIDSAIANAPQMGMAEAALMQSEYNAQLVKKDWSELVSVTGRYTYGQFLVSDNLGLDIGEERGGYQFFGGVTLPLSYFIGRKQRIGALEASVKIEEYRKSETKKQIIEEVVETYNRLLLLQQLIDITAEARESALLQYEMAEEGFRNGELSLEELGNSTTMKARFASDYESLKSEFGSVYSRLERLVGTPFRKFPK